MTTNQKQILQLIMRSEPDSEGSYKVSGAVLPLVERAKLGDLIEVHKTLTETRLRLTVKGETVCAWL